MATSRRDDDSPTRRTENSPALALFHYFWSSNVVVLAYLFSGDYLIKSSDVFRMGNESSTPFNSHDGQWYKVIATSGYDYYPDHSSRIAFFPLYPLCCRLASFVFMLDMDVAMLLVSNVALIGSSLLLAHYFDRRFPIATSGFRRNTLLAFAVFPTTFFFRMGYSESCFVFILLAYLILLRGGANPFVLAATAGLLTAARTPGVAVIPTTLLALWRVDPTWWGRAWKAVLILPLSCWGLLAFMAYQFVRFGEPLGFVKAQNFFKGRPTPPFLEKAWALATFEPIRVLFDPNLSPLLRGTTQVAFNLGSVDPIIFLLFAGLVAYGAWERILTRDEVLISAAMLLICYGSIGYESFMRSQGRYASAVIPVYFVIGRLLSLAGDAVAAAVIAVLTVLLFTYACLFLSGYFLV